MIKTYTLVEPTILNDERGDDHTFLTDEIVLVNYDAIPPEIQRALAGEVDDIDVEYPDECGIPEGYELLTVMYKPAKEGE